MLEELKEIQCGGPQKTGGHGTGVVGEVIRGLVSLLWTLGVILECDEIHQRTKHGNNAVGPLEALSGFLTDEEVQAGAGGKDGGRARAWVQSQSSPGRRRDGWEWASVRDLEVGSAEMMVRSLVLADALP